MLPLVLVLLLLLTICRALCSSCVMFPLQVALLLSIGEEETALKRAVTSGSGDLVTAVLLQLERCAHHAAENFFLLAQRCARHVW